MKSGWHVIRVFAGSEVRVAADINGAGFTAYCPVVTKPLRRRYAYGAPMTEVERSLFPGYLFLLRAADFRREWFENTRTKLRVFYRPLVSEETIAMVRTIAELESRWRVEKPGDVVRLMRTALAGELGKVIKIKRGWATVDVMRNGNRTQVTVAVDDMERVSRVAI